MAERELDAFLSLKLVNTYYLSDFTSLDTARPTSYVRPIAVIVDASSACLVVPLLDEEAAGETSAIDDVRCYSDAPAAAAARALVVERLHELGATRVGVEQDAISGEWIAGLKGSVPGLELVFARDLIETLRLRKDEREIDTLRRAAELADVALAASLAASAPGVAEITAETGGLLAMREAAAAEDGDGSMVDCIPMVLSGPRSSMPHEFTTARRLGVNELMWHCWLVSYRGYWVENIRTGVVAPRDAAFVDEHALLRESLLAGQEAARPGAVAGDVHRAVMGVLGRHRIPGAVVLNRCGHGMGLEYHEPPFVEDVDETPLEPGVVMTVEPGLWIPGTGGLALSDTLVVRDGGAEVLTTTSHDLYAAPDDLYAANV